MESRMHNRVAATPPDRLTAAFLRGVLPPPGELDVRIERIEGELPPELAGAFYTIGPVGTDVFGHPNNHWFDGEGMVAMFRLDAGRASFCNRFIQTAHSLAEQR